MHIHIQKINICNIFVTVTPVVNAHLFLTLLSNVIKKGY